MRIAPSYSSISYTAWVAGVYSLLVCVVLITSFVVRRTQLALDDPRYQALKLQIEKDPADQDSRSQILALDAQLRSRYFQQQEFLRRGAYLLAGGVMATLLLTHWATTIRRRLPRPKLAGMLQDAETKSNQWAQWATGGVIVVLLSIVVASQAASRSVLSSSLSASADALTTVAGTESASPEVAETSPVGDTPSETVQTVASANQPDAPAVDTPVSKEQFALSWPRFRGVEGGGISAFQDIPTTWDGASGEGVLWKTPVPLPGVSSPIVWQDRVFLTGATAEQREVYCFAIADGSRVWQRAVGADIPNTTSLKVGEETGFAAPTPATDGKRVYAMFARGDLAAFDFAGKQLWYTNLGTPENHYGHASSLATYENLLIVQLDQGTARDDKSRLLAFHGATGEIAWEVKRAVPASWSSPIVANHDGQAQIIAISEPWVIAYAADDGRELWRADCLGGEVGPSPVYDRGVVYVANDNAVVAAIDAGGQGDVTESHVRWTAEFALPDICSPLLMDRQLLLVTSYGTLASYDRESGGEEPLWEQQLDGICMASPSRVGGRVYLISDDGKGSVLEPQEAGCEKLAENDLGEPCFASPAFQPGRIYIRGEYHLFCIGDK